MTPAQLIARIQSDLAQLSAHVALVGSAPAASAAPARSTTTARAVPTVSDDEVDIDGPHGNPEIRRDPPRWDGQSFAGQRFSDATPAYLRSLAGFREWSAGRNDEKAASGDEAAAKYARYDRLDAARARRWAARIESSAQRTAIAPPPADEESDDVPF